MAKNLHLPIWLLWSLRVALACLLMAGLGWYVEPTRLYERLCAIDGSLLGLCLLLGAAGLGVQLTKWQCLLVRFRPETTWNEGLGSLLAGFGLGLFSPGRMGELGRGVVLGGDQTTWIGLSAVDRACSAAVSLVLGWVALAVLHPPLALVLVGIGGVVAGVGYAVRLRLLGMATSWSWWVRGRAVLAAIDRGLWVRVLLWSVVFNLLFLIQFFLLLSSWGPPPAAVAWGVPAFFALKLLLPFSVMDIGVREGAALLVFTPLGLDPAVAFNAAFIQFVINVVLPGVGGWVLLYSQIHRRLGRRVSLREVSALSLLTRR